jgi:tetratricopeptide (TPR) repeat protein
MSEVDEPSQVEAELRVVYLDTSVYSWLAELVDEEATHHLRTAAAELGFKVIASELVLLELFATSDPGEADHLADVVTRLADRVMAPPFETLVALVAGATAAEHGLGVVEPEIVPTASDAWQRALDDPSYRLQLDDTTKLGLRRLKLKFSVVLAALRAREPPDIAFSAASEVELESTLEDLRRRAAAKMSREEQGEMLGTIASSIFYFGLTLYPEPIEKFWRGIGRAELSQRLAAGPEFLAAVMGRIPFDWMLDYLSFHADRQLKGNDWVDSIHVSYLGVVPQMFSRDHRMVEYGRAVTEGRLAHGEALVGPLAERARLLALDERRKRAREAQGEHDRCAELHALARRLVYENLLAEAEPAFVEALALAQSVDDTHACRCILSNMAQVYRELGDLASAQTLLTDALATEDASGDGGGTALMLVQLGCVHEHRGDAAQARRLYEQAVAHAEEGSEPAALSSALDKIARQHAMDGDLVTAVDLWRRAIATLSRQDDGELAAAIDVNLALATWRVGGRPGDAHEMLQTAVRRLRRHGSRRTLALALAYQAGAATTDRQRAHRKALLTEAVRILIEFGSFDEALEALACDLDEDSGDPPPPIALQALFLAASTGNPRGLIPCLRVVTAHALDDEIMPILGTTLVWLARLADGSPPEPGPQGQEAVKLLEECARRGGARDRDSFIAWLERHELRDPRVFVPRLREWILAQLPAAEWLFDPERVVHGSFL